MIEGGVDNLTARDFKSNFFTTKILRKQKRCRTYKCKMIYIHLPQNYLVILKDESENNVATFYLLHLLIIYLIVFGCRFQRLNVETKLQYYI